jgi:hypothetical protein
MVRATIPWGCRIANLQRPKRNSLKKKKNKNTQESKCTFQSTKQMRPRRGQRPSAQSDKDKKHTQPYKGAITMKDNIWTLLVAAYAHQDTRPWVECGLSRQCKDAILRGGEEAAASDQVNTIDIRASCMRRAEQKREAKAKPPMGQRGLGGWRERQSLGTAVSPTCNV